MHGSRSFLYPVKSGPDGCHASEGRTCCQAGSIFPANAPLRIRYASRVINKVARALPTPALRKVHEEPGTPRVAAASEIKSLGDRRANPRLGGCRILDVFQVGLRKSG